MMELGKESESMHVHRKYRDQCVLVSGTENINDGTWQRSESMHVHRK